MSEITFAQVVKGGQIEVRQDNEKRILEKVVNVTTTKIGVKIALANRDVFMVDMKSARVLTEFYNNRNGKTYVVPQKASK
jgi:hypothetical protein